MLQHFIIGNVSKLGEQKTKMDYGLYQLELDVLSNIKENKTVVYDYSVEFLSQRMMGHQEKVIELGEELAAYEREQMGEQRNLIVYLMISFVVLHSLVILAIVPVIKKINELYSRVLAILSRVTVTECQEEIRKLTLSSHLLSDCNWITQNQVKLIFYNKNKDLDINSRKKKDSQYLSVRLTDTTLTYWKDMLLYILISVSSVVFLIIATLANQPT